MREIYIHIGTHKTGTTSIQSFLGSNREVLEKGGLYVPRSGTLWPASGHHNIAWELRNDKRFDPGLGTVSDLIAELRDVKCRKAVLSSEDFEYLSQYPHRLKLFDDELRALGFQRKYAAFFRAKRDYLFSLSCELRKFDVEESYSSLRNQVKKDGCIIVNGDWYFEFDYKRFRQVWASCIGDNLICLSYDKEIWRRGIIWKFLSTMTVDEELLLLCDHAPRLNESAIKPDELCPCQSGLRFKYCHGLTLLKWLNYARATAGV